MITSDTNDGLAISIRDAFLEMGGMAMATSLLTIPMYVCANGFAAGCLAGCTLRRTTKLSSTEPSVVFVVYHFFSGVLSFRLGGWWNLDQKALELLRSTPALLEQI